MRNIKIVLLVITICFAIFLFLQIKKKNQKMRNAKIILFLATIYFIILLLGQCIPTEWVIGNAYKSSMILNEQGVYGEILNGVCYDNWTESYFINAAITHWDGNVLQRMIANAYTVLPGYENDPLACLEYAVNQSGVEETLKVPYSRYWAGATALIKVLLIFMDLNGIRSLVFMLILFLFGITCINIYEVLGYKGCIAFGLSTFASMYIPNSLCLTFSFDIIIMLFGINICWNKMKRKDSYKSYLLVFGIIGSISSYIGYWAFPLITLGIPLVFLTALRFKEGIDEGVIVKQNFLCSVVWTIGIIVTIVVKQITARLFLGYQSGSEHIATWVGVGNDLKERFEAVGQGLIREFQHIEVIVAFVIAMIVLIFMKKNKQFRMSKNVIPYLMIAIYPIVWWWIFYVHCGHGFVRYMYGVAYFAVFVYLMVQCNGDLKNENRNVK